MIVYFNIRLGKEEVCWRAKNGELNRTLQIINNTGLEINENESIKCELEWLNSKTHSFLCVNKAKIKDDRICGVFLNQWCGFLTNKTTMKEASSNGGPGNSESKMAILFLETEIQVLSYKNKNGSSYYILGQEGFKVREIYESGGSKIEII